MLLNEKWPIQRETLMYIIIWGKNVLHYSLSLNACGPKLFLNKIHNMQGNVTKLWFSEFLPKWQLHVKFKENLSIIKSSCPYLPMLNS